RRCHCLGDLVLAAVAGHAIDEFADLTLGNGAHEAIDGLTVLESNDGRDGLYSQLTSYGRMVVDVHLDEPDLAGGLGDRLPKGRTKAPRNRPGPAVCAIPR